MSRASRLLCAVLAVPLLVASACSSDSTSPRAAPTSTTPRSGSAGAGSVPAGRGRVLVRGHLTLDGAPFDARFLGAVVRRDGLETACQYTLPPVANGRYEIVVFAEQESSGCGAPGAEILLWTFVRGKTFFTSRGVPWPAGHGADFDANFSTAAPNGAVPPRAEFSGDAFSHAGARLPAGTHVEAYVGDTRCGVASTRRTGNFSGYILTVVGPDVIAGCARGAKVTFRVNGKPVAQTSVNVPSVRGVSLDLTTRD